MARKTGGSPTWGRWLLLVAVAILVGGAIWWVLERTPERPTLDRDGSSAETEADAPTAMPEAGDRTPAIGETEPGEESAPSGEETAAAQESERRGPAGHVAIVVDDLGDRVADVERLVALGVPLSFAVLPYAPETEQTVAVLQDRGEEILCHLPMQPTGDSHDPGPGAITAGMEHREIERATRRALGRVPGAVGVNNHMGSEMTSRGEVMAAVFDVIAERGLFYLDSRTTGETVAYRLARRRGIPTAERHVFLDASADAKSIRTEFRRLLDIARRRGAAVAIAHPTAATLSVLEEEVPEALAAGFNFVPVSFLLDRSTSFDSELADEAR